MAYRYYEITFILEDAQEERLEKLEEQFRLINGWNKQEILQFANEALNNIEMMLTFMEIKATQIT